MFNHHSLPEYCCWSCPSLYDYSVPFWCTSSRIMHHVTKLKSSQTGFLNITMSSLYSMASTSPDLNPTEHLWDVEEREIHIMDVQPTNLQQLRDAIMTIWSTSLRNVSNTLLNQYHEELRQFWRVQPGTSKVYL